MLVAVSLCFVDLAVLQTIKLYFTVSLTVLVRWMAARVRLLKVLVARTKTRHHECFSKKGLPVAPAIRSEKWLGTREPTTSIRLTIGKCLCFSVNENPVP
jgi:hypothetical protein